MQSVVTQSIDLDIDDSIYRHTDHTLSELVEVEAFEYIHADGVAEEITYRVRLRDEPPLSRQELGQVVAQLVGFLASTAQS